MNKSKEEKVHIAVIIVGWNMDYRLELLEGMYEAAECYHCALHFYTCLGGMDERYPFVKSEYDLFDLPDYTLYDGIVFISNTAFAENVVQQLSLKFSRLNIPVICTDHRLQDFGFMGTDNYVAMKSMVEHMVKVHHYKNFRMLAGPKNNRESNHRVQAFRDVLEAHGIIVKEDDIYNANYTMKGAIDALDYYLEKEDGLPDAFICANDLMALTICWELQKKGYQVPEDVAVTGFDNIVQTKVSQPSITSIGRGKKQMGMEAVKLLVQRIHGEQDNIDYYIPYELCIRESCGCKIKPEVSFEEFRDQLYGYDMEKRFMIHFAGIMEDDLVGCRNYNEFILSIRKHIPKRFVNKFFICLNQSVADMLNSESGAIEKLLEFEKSTVCYDTYFSVPIAYDFDTYKSYDKLNFNEVIKLINYEGNRNTRGHEDVAYFLPLRFRDCCYGFIVFAGNRANITNDFIGNYVKRIANSLEQLRIHRIESLTICKLEDLYETDSMTGLYNRFGYKKCINELVARYKSSNDSIMVQFFDMDELKRINDIYGHDVGNKAINIVANSMRHVFRDEYLIRYGGDEFVALGVNQTDASMQLKNKEFRELVKMEEIRHNFKYPIEVSIGYHIAKHPEHADADMWINKADKAMYKDKLKKKKKVRGIR